jgi:hypothetical protein
VLVLVVILFVVMVADNLRVATGRDDDGDCGIDYDDCGELDRGGNCSCDVGGGGGGGDVERSFRDYPTRGSPFKLTHTRTHTRTRSHTQLTHTHTHTHTYTHKHTHTHTNLHKLSLSLIHTHTHTHTHTPDGRHVSSRTPRYLR